MKQKMMRVSECSPEGEERLADGVCAVSGKDLAMSESTTLELIIQEGGGNATGTGVRYIGRGYAPTHKQAADLVELVLAEVKKWSE